MFKGLSYVYVSPTAVKPHGRAGDTRSDSGMRHSTLHCTLQGRTTLTLVPVLDPNTCAARALIRLLALPVVTAGTWDEACSGAEVSMGTSFSSFSLKTTTGTFS